MSGARRARRRPPAPARGRLPRVSEDSELLRAANDYYPEGCDPGGCGEFPPLVQAHSWTKGVPYRDSFHHVPPSDSIGNCYTSRTKTFRVPSLRVRRRSPPPLYGPVGPRGELQFPPLRPWKEREKERLASRAAERGKHKLQKGYCQQVISVTVNVAAYHLAPRETATEHREMCTALGTEALRI
ncbi:Dynein heavy chain 3, axonemal [Eumeta japonica]|uniref:Dynein heavy chain 3, axonemal n=1 Tax=Eumeta variegata TaxID=151549 RepID=A0A4C1ZBS4_EUMVA|nr:Dynein heavy chain 3, axonemal [Eumeta japonica]